MTTMDIEKEMVTPCRQGKNQEAIDRFYAQNVESVEAGAMPGIGRVQRVSSPSRERANGRIIKEELFYAMS